MTATGAIHEDGVVVMADGRIQAVGPADAVQVPEGATLVDVEGRVVTPGVIDTHSHMGVYPVPHVRAHSDGNEATSPNTAQVAAADSIWPQDPALQRALAAGVTTIHVLPGSANLFGGRGATLKLHLGRSVSEMRFPAAPDSLKMACGENPKRVYGGRRQFPSTRMGNVSGYRAAFQEAVEYGRSWGEWQHKHRIWQRKRMRYDRDQERRRAAREGEGEMPEGDPVDDPGPEPAPPTRDFAKETLWDVLQGRVLVQMHCYRADEMTRMMELAREFGFRIRSFHHAVEAYKVRDLLAREGVSISTWADWWGFKVEAYDAIPENLALLEEAGVRAIVHSDSNMLVQRLNQEAAKAMWAGRHRGIDISEDAALRWFTTNAAWALGVHEVTGTLEPGKMADVVVWSDDPFSVYTHADLVFVDGLLRYDRAEQPASPPTPENPTTDFEQGQNETEALPILEGGAR
ncbi:MAG: amidohydrolase [Sandaracinus sp.]|nr:amidohydrolase [Sandaracinus sp.]MBJ70277.1 amidohydrolase [Sandaracinus sp.]